MLELFELRQCQIVASVGQGSRNTKREKNIDIKMIMTITALQR